jgi:hypothetical protein
VTTVTADGTLYQRYLKILSNSTFSWHDFMTDMNYRPDRYPNFTAEELQIIRYFTQGQKHSISSNNLKLEYTETSIRLSNNSGKLLGIAKQTKEWQRKVLITNNSIYRTIILQNLAELGFIDLNRSSHPNFTEHHYYNIPDGYKLNYTEVIQLWRSWWNNKRYEINVTNLPIDISIFVRGNWYQVQDLQPRQGNFILQTERGELTIPPEDYVVWIDRIESISSNLPSQVGAADSARVSAQSIDNVELSAQEEQEEQEEEEVDLESYLNTFTIEETGDIDRIEGIYNISELLSNTNREEDISAISLPMLDATNSLPSEPEIISTQTNSIELGSGSTLSELPTTQSSLAYSQAQQALKLKAINALSRYLQQGDIMVRTEVFRNGQGQEINRKVTTIQRGCPRWVIDQIRQLS